MFGSFSAWLVVMGDSFHHLSKEEEFAKPLCLVDVFFFHFAYFAADLLGLFASFVEHFHDSDCRRLAAEH